ncbi:acylneuraminate cytidylyltransferase family protein, partial [Candidatus Bipolaricaulota bacterium]|nr:acylneuraminate cytidylyltransferase family protein [Candidatus Bipolaricaulota bacterium]
MPMEIAVTASAHPMIALIPARGGSKGIPGKNLALLHGVPLIDYTIKAARAAETVDRIILSTDDERIAEFCRRRGVEVPWMRPAELAEDGTLIVSVLAHLLEWLKESGVTPEAMILLQPTSPLRRAEHIDAAVRAFRAKKADTLVSVVEVPHQYTPDSLMRLDDAGLLEFPSKGQPATRRQDKATLYARNGPAILI